jgi:hypothetical protein
MKKITFIVLLLLTLSVRAQQTDILYVPSQNSLVISYNFKQVGVYFGGYSMTTLPQPYIYTTPISIMNRVGLTYLNKNNTYGIMCGTFIQSYPDKINLTPDVWVKIYPIRMITKNKKSLDFSLGVNYSNGFRYGIGLSI